MTTRDSHNTSTEDLLQQAMRMHQSGRADEADRLYADVLEAEPTHAQALRLRGILARERGDMTTSFDCLNQAIEQAPDDADPLCEMALSHMAIGDLNMAEGALRAAIDIDDTAVKAFANLGALLQYRGHDREAIEMHQKALQHDPDDIEVRCNLAKALADVGHVEEALRECDTATEGSFGFPLPLAIKGSILCDSGQYNDAVPILEQAVSRDPGNDTALVNLGFAFMMLDQIPNAERAMQRALMMNPSNARAASDLINILARQGRIEEALDIGQSFLEHHPAERMVLSAYAYALYEVGDLDGARQIHDYDQMVTISDLDVPQGYDDQATFHQALTKVLLENPSLIANPANKSTYGGGQTGELDLASCEPLQAFDGMIKDAVNRQAAHLHASGFSAQTRMSAPPAYWSLRAWGTILGEGGHQTPHMHPLGWLSGVYYASLPEDMTSGHANAGCLEFGQPPDRYVLHRQPPTRMVAPQEGRLVTFPSYFYHRTEPFQSAQPRISIAFDVMPAQEIGVF